MRKHFATMSAVLPDHVCKLRTSECYPGNVRTLLDDVHPYSSLLEDHITGGHAMARNVTAELLRSIRHASTSIGLETDTITS